MKRSSKRRRTKQEIKDAKVQEEEKKAEIEAKLARFEQMEARMQELEGIQANEAQLTEAFQYLRNQGLVKAVGGTGYEAVGTFDEA